ncbi:Vitamin K epoxide reductase complex subunit 1-like protein 1 [Mactra antiquata]
MKNSAKQPRYTVLTTVVISVVGMILSVYAYHVETSIHSDPTFRALCDISAKMSCSKVFSSRYGTGFGILEYIVGKDSFLNQPNSVYGMIFYIQSAILATTMTYELVLVQLISSILAGLGCVYLAYILIYILDDFCVVCVSTYVINAILLICAFLKYRAIQNVQVSKKNKTDKMK